MGTTTDVFAQRTALTIDETPNPVELALEAESLGGYDFGDVLTEQTLPNSMYSNIREVVQELEKGNPEYHPDGLPFVQLDGAPFIGTPSENAKINTLPSFWLRNQNIDLDSCWYGVFTEKGLPYNNTVTPYNDEVWQRDLDDPDINRIPEDGFPLLSSRPIPLSFFEPTKDAVPYEIVYPEWFTAHPEYVKTHAILQTLGIDPKKDILNGIRDSEGADDVDHILLGYFSSFLPRVEEEANYIYRFFRQILKDVAFTGSNSKKISPCVSLAGGDGFFKKDGESVGFINNEGDNYYYEDVIIPSIPIINGVNGEETPFFSFHDSKDEMNLSFRASSVVVRKVRGKLKDSYHNKVVYSIGKGSTVPEFTYFNEPVYLSSPTNQPPAALVGNVDTYDNTVIRDHKILFNSQDSGLLDDIMPVAYISIKVQKNWSTYNGGQHEWDLETGTGLNVAAGLDYYEEILIINPRTVYKGVYSAGFSSKGAHSIFHNGSSADTDVYWLTSDDPDIKRFNGTSYTDEDIGSRFDGDFEDSDALILPTVLSAINELRLKEREPIVSRSLSVLTISIVRRKVSSFGKVLQAAITLATIYFILIPGVKEFGAFLAGLAEEELKTEILKQLVLQYVEFKAFEAIGEELLEFIIEELGLDNALLITVLATAFSAYATMKNPKAMFGKDWTASALKLSVGFDDTYQKAISDEFTALNTDAENLREAQVQSEERLQEITDDGLQINPNMTRQTMLYSLENETPSDFYYRSKENRNPGIELYSLIGTQIARWQYLGYDELPVIATDELSEEDYLDQLI